MRLPSLCCGPNPVRRYSFSEDEPPIFGLSRRVPNGILYRLARCGRATNQQIWHAVWGDDIDGGPLTDNIGPQMHYLRKHLKASGAPVTITAIRGHGYEITEGLELVRAEIAAARQSWGSE